MPLQDGYGVLLGTLSVYKRDDPNDFGRFMHGVLTVSADGGQYKCAVDVDTHDGQIAIEWRVHPLRASEWAALFALPDGWHDLAPQPQSGAVDYIRDHRLKDLIYIPEYLHPEPAPWEPPERLRVLPHTIPIVQPRYTQTPLSPRVAIDRSGLEVAAADLLRAPIAKMRQMDTVPMSFLSHDGKAVFLDLPWNSGVSTEALADLEAVLAGAVRVAVFGEPFHTGLGVHNIHQNQGDPIGSPFSAENGIWQDGITIAFRADGTASAFLNKFSTQAFETDNQGRPLP